MHHPSGHPSIMADLLAKTDPNAEIFTIRRLDMRGHKVDIPSKLIRSELHCFFFVTSGEALIEIGEESHYFKSNECAAIPAGHAFAVRYFDNCIGYMGGFNEDYLSSNNDGRNIIQSFSILRRWGSHKVLFDSEHGKHIAGILERLCLENEERKNKNIIRSYLTSLLTEIEEASLMSESANDNTQTENEQCNKFIELVFAHNDHSISLSEYAAKLNTTKDNLHRIIKKHTGKTPLDWINEAVILEAKVLLSRTSMPISEVAAATGFDDPSYFSRLFKKNTGTTPAEYRKGRKSQNIQE